MSLTQKIGQVIALSTLIFGSFVPSAFSATVPQEKAQETKSGTLLAQATVETNQLKFELKNCQMVRKKVVCEMLVTNITDNFFNYFFQVVNKYKATDFSGNIYELSNIGIGKKVYSGNVNFLNVDLSPQIPTKFSLYFSIPQNVNKLAGIEFSTGKNRIIFRNVSIGDNRGTKRKCTCQ